MPKESFYITPRRLETNSFLYKSVHMMKIINPDRPIHLPNSTVTWLRSGNWRKIPIESALMCIQYAEFDLEYPWHEDLDRAEKILDELILIPSKQKKALRSQYLREETLANFIDITYKDIVEKENAEMVKEGYSSWNRTSRAHEEVYRWVLSNTELKPYMIESLWQLTPLRSQSHLLTYLADNVAVNKISDQIFSKILSEVVSGAADTSLYFRDTRIARIFSEALRRGMLIRAVPEKATLPSEQRPLVFNPRLPRSTLAPIASTTGETTDTFTSVHLFPAKTA